VKRILVVTMALAFATSLLGGCVVRTGHGHSAVTHKSQKSNKGRDHRSHKSNKGKHKGHEK